MNGGPGTGGDNGHVVIFERWASSDHSRVVVYEQTPPQTIHHTRSYPGAPFKAYRYKNIVDDAPRPAEGPVHEASSGDQWRNQPVSGASGVVTGSLVAALAVDGAKYVYTI
jgi:hypothetical protein